MNVKERDNVSGYTLQIAVYRLCEGSVVKNQRADNAEFVACEVRNSPPDRVSLVPTQPDALFYST